MVGGNNLVDAKYDISAVQKYDIDMQRFDFAAAAAVAAVSAAGNGSGGSGPCMPKFEAKYEPNLSMQQSSPISLTTGGGSQHTS